MKPDFIIFNGATYWRYEGATSNAQLIHVIEKSAYDELRAALEFYANPNNWSYTTYDVCQTGSKDDLGIVPSRSPAFGKKTESGYVYECGGKLAREILKRNG